MQNERTVISFCILHSDFCIDWIALPFSRPECPRPPAARPTTLNPETRHAQGIERCHPAPCGGPRFRPSRLGPVRRLPRPRPRNLRGCGRPSIAPAARHSPPPHRPGADEGADGRRGPRDEAGGGPVRTARRFAEHVDPVDSGPCSRRAVRSSRYRSGRCSRPARSSTAATTAVTLHPQTAAAPPVHVWPAAFLVCKESEVTEVKQAAHSEPADDLAPPPWENAEAPAVAGVRRRIEAAYGRQVTGMAAETQSNGVVVVRVWLRSTAADPNRGKIIELPQAPGSGVRVLLEVDR